MFSLALMQVNVAAALRITPLKQGAQKASSNTNLTLFKKSGSVVSLWAWFAPILLFTWPLIKPYHFLESHALYLFGLLVCYSFRNM